MRATSDPFDQARFLGNVAPLVAGFNCEATLSETPSQYETPRPMYQVSFETLVHYICPLCKSWWSIGDGSTIRPYFCPNCGQDLAPPPA